MGPVERAMKDHATHPHTLNVALLCQDDGRVAGQWPLLGMQRLHDSLFAAPGAASAVDWSASGTLLPAPGGEPQVWLHLQASAPVALQCQRCLQAVAQTLVVDRRLRFVRSETEAERLDETSEDDVLVLSPRLDLHALVEDELILALPLVPRHDGPCPEPLPMPADDLADEEPAPNPFAALAALRTRRQDGKT